MLPKSAAIPSPNGFAGLCLFRNLSSRFWDRWNVHQSAIRLYPLPRPRAAPTRFSANLLEAMSFKHSILGYWALGKVRGINAFFVKIGGYIYIYSIKSINKHISTYVDFVLLLATDGLCRLRRTTNSDTPPSHQLQRLPVPPKGPPRLHWKPAASEGYLKERSWWMINLLVGIIHD